MGTALSYLVCLLSELQLEYLMLCLCHSATWRNGEYSYSLVSLLVEEGCLNISSNSEPCQRVFKGLCWSWALI